MRRWLLLLVGVLLLHAFPITVRAASGTVLENLKVQLWPEYDRPDVLVIYDFTLDAQTTLPATLHFRMPANAELVAVAKNSANGLLTVDYETPTPEGDYNVFSFQATEQTDYHFEYYVPYMLDGNTRNFVFTWPGDYAVKSLDVALQEPHTARNIQSEPALANTTTDSNGFVYQSTSAANLLSGQSFTLKISYQKDDNTLSTSTLNVQAASPLTGDVPGQVSLMTYLPWVLLGLGVVLVVGGMGWYLISNRDSHSTSKIHRQHGAHDETQRDDEAAGTKVYCHQCGKRAQAGDVFCRACGTPLRQSES